MLQLAKTKKIAFWVCVLVLILQILGSRGEELTEEEKAAMLKEEQQEKKEEENAIPQDLGTGVHEEKDLMDICQNAAGPRPLNKVFSPGRTNYATVDDVNGGFCGVSIDSPGIWWRVKGTGRPIKVSSCHLQTDIKVKFSVFTGSCDDLQCVSGGAEPDFECTIPELRRDTELGEWDTMSSAHIFETEEEKDYFVLVQQTENYGRGTVWINFREPNVPQNDNCPDAIGPVPRDLTRVENSHIDATVSKVYDYCGGEGVPALYPGTWFQIMGTGEPVTIMACGDNNFDGYAFSVYNGAYCDGMECMEGQYEINVEDPEKCTFGSARVVRPLTKYKFETHDRDRYWIYVHAARTRAETPTSDFRFYVDDGKEGDASSSGASTIAFDGGIVGVKREDAEKDNNRDRNNDNTRVQQNASSDGAIVDFHRGGLSLFVFLVSWMIQDYGLL